MLIQESWQTKKKTETKTFCKKIRHNEPKLKKVGPEYSRLSQHSVRKRAGLILPILRITRSFVTGCTCYPQHGKQNLTIPLTVTSKIVNIVGHVSRPYTSNLSTVGDRAFPDCRCTSLEHSVAARSVIQFFVNFQASAQDRALLTKLHWLMWLREFSSCL